MKLMNITSTKCTNTARPAKSKDNNAVMWVALVIVVLIVAVVSYTAGTYSASNSGKQNSQTAPSELNSSYGTQPVTTIMQESNMSLPTPVSVGSVKYFITPTEAASIIGQGGGTAFASTTPAQLNSPILQNYSIKGLYDVQYNNNATNTAIKGDLGESIAVTTKSKSLYEFTLGNSKPYFNSTYLKLLGVTNSTYAINQTEGGMTYSFYSVVAPLPPANYLVTQTMLVGFKNNVTVLVQLGKTNTSSMFNVTQIAGIVAAHLT